MRWDSPGMGTYLSEINQSINQYLFFTCKYTVSAAFYPSHPHSWMSGQQGGREGGLLPLVLELYDPIVWLLGREGKGQIACDRACSVFLPVLGHSLGEILREYTY